jgi:hypothetical protein
MKHNNKAINMYSLSTDSIAPKHGSTVDISACTVNSPIYTFSASLIGVDASAPATVTATVTCSDGCALLSFKDLAVVFTDATILSTAAGVNPMPPPQDAGARYQYYDAASPYGMTFIAHADGSISWTIPVATAAAATLRGTTIRYAL